jgi:hypothetical protein
VLYFEVLVFEFATIDRLSSRAGTVSEVTALREDRGRSEKENK